MKFLQHHGPPTQGFLKKNINCSQSIKCHFVSGKTRNTDNRSRQSWGRIELGPVRQHPAADHAALHGRGLRSAGEEPVAKATNRFCSPTTCQSDVR